MSSKYKYNKHGRSFCYGESLSLDIRELIIQKIKDLGGIASTTFVPRGVKSRIAERFCVTEGTVRRLWKQYCATGDVLLSSSLGISRENTRILTEEDLDYVHILKLQDPCIFNSEIKACLAQYSNNPLAKDVSLSTIQRTTRHRLPGGLYTWKKVNSSERKRWEDHNIRYTEAFLARLRHIDPRKVFFVDEAGVCKQSGKRTRGQSIIGTRAISITDHTPGINYSLILLVGLGGCIYAEITSEKVDAVRFTQFITSAKLSFLADGAPVIPDNSIIVLDNASIHVSLANNVIRPFLAQSGVSYIFLPTYSPDFSPAEACFMMLKETLKKECYNELLFEDTQTCILLALNEITDDNIRAFYKNVPFNYLGM